MRTIPESMNYNKDQSSHYKHLNDIIAAYLGYGLKVKRLYGTVWDYATSIPSKM